MLKTFNLAANSTVADLQRVVEEMKALPSRDRVIVRRGDRVLGRFSGALRRNKAVAFFKVMIDVLKEVERETQVYHLETPACACAIYALLKTIGEEGPPEERIHLEMGTCRLECQDERGQFSDKVTRSNAADVLIEAFMGSKTDTSWCYQMAIDGLVRKNGECLCPVIS